MSERYWLGVDPGADGAVAALRDDGSLLRILDCPDDLDTLRLTLLELVGDMLQNGRDLCQVVGLAALEEAQVRPTEARASTKSFVENWASWKATLACMFIPYERPHPTRWQKDVLDGVKRQKGQVKEQVWAWARRRYPEAVLAGPRGARLYGRSDALGLAYHAWKRGQGK